jgi:hypothetical protein
MGSLKKVLGHVGMGTGAFEPFDQVWEGSACWFKPG